MVDIRERHFGRITSDVSTPANVGALVRRLLLFEDYTLESIRFSEIRPLLTVFGFDGVMQLLKCTDFHVLYDARTFANIGPKFDTVEHPQRATGRYRITPIRLAGRQGDPARDRAWCVRNALDEVKSTWSLATKRTNQLWSELERNVLEEPESAIEEAQLNLRTDLENNDPIVRRAIALGFRDRKLDLDIRSLQINIETLSDDNDYRVETNLDAAGISREQAHSIVERALLSVAGLNHRIALMNAFDAITGFREDEIALFDAKLKSLARPGDPSEYEQTFELVMQIADLPDLDNVAPGTFLNAGQLLAIRATPEWQTLRRWLRSNSGANEDEIRLGVRSATASLPAAFHGTIGKTIRFLVTTGLGFTGLVPGAAATASDKLLERLIGSPGPVSAIESQYRSIFET